MKQGGDDKILISRTKDAIQSALDGGCSFTNFLDEFEAAKCESIVAHYPEVNCLRFGGFSMSTRCMVCISPSFIDIGLDDFPLSVIKLTYRKNSSLTHRDFLGALMNLRIARETIGDIAVFDGYTYISAKIKIANLILNELTLVGNEGVKCEFSEVPCDEKTFRLESHVSVVSSMRFDCIISVLVGKGRKTATDLIKSSKCAINYVEVVSSSKQLSLGDIVTIRGFGKYKISDNIGTTKKGKTRVEYFKYI